MQVNTCGLTRIANEANQLSAFHFLAFAHCRLLQVGITSLVAVTMVDGDHVTVAPVPFFNIGNHTIACGVGFSAHLRGEINAAMEFFNLINGVGTVAEIRRDILELRFLQGEDGRNVRQHR